ncbi:MAG: hypothetical protein EOP24_27595 [Hyphomicrobiales bacterium]|nr:MAG: hypothetical protein EOP24_27595 [Hyphomicrobiales bacterium]
MADLAGEDFDIDASAGFPKSGSQPYDFYHLVARKLPRQVDGRFFFHTDYHVTPIVVLTVERADDAPLRNDDMFAVMVTQVTSKGCSFRIRRLDGGQGTTAHTFRVKAVVFYG